MYFCTEQLRSVACEQETLTSLITSEYISILGLATVLTGIHMVITLSFNFGM